MAGIPAGDFAVLALWTRARALARLGTSFAFVALTGAIASAQSVTTDKLDYLPGDTVLINGTGFHRYEWVTLQVVHIPESPCCSTGNGHLPWTTYTDDLGSFADSWYVDPDDSFGAVFLLTADCADGLHAETYFTDALGSGRIANVAGVAGSCVQLTTVGVGPNALQNWEVEKGGTYLITLTNVTECTGASIQVLLHSGNFGDECVTATNNAPQQYTFLWTVPEYACRTLTIQYCTTGCNPLSGWTARQPNGTNTQLGHLRVSRFGPGCTNPVPTTEYECCPDPVLTCPITFSVSPCALGANGFCAS
jgi:hypothetical protein